MKERFTLANALNIKTRYGTFSGFVDERGVKTWLGIPFVQPPDGSGYACGFAGG